MDKDCNFIIQTQLLPVSHHNQSQVLEQIIREILENGRTAVFAIKKKIERNRVMNQEDINNEIDNIIDNEMDIDEFPF